MSSVSSSKELSSGILEKNAEIIQISFSLDRSTEIIGSQFEFHKHFQITLLPCPNCSAVVTFMIILWSVICSASAWFKNEASL